MEYKMAVITTASEGVEHVSNLLITVGVGGFEVCDSADFMEFLNTRTPAYDYVDDALMSLCSQRSCIKFYAADNEQGENTVNMVERALIELKNSPLGPLCGTLEMNVSVVDDSDWKDNWKQFYKPITIDGLVVCPAWETVNTDKKILKIDPGMAFGTGSHETTSLCLEFLQTLDLSDKRVLDVGCGSGILSQAAVLLGAPYACGCDIDDAATTCALANAKLNGLSDKTDYFTGDLLEKITGEYDVVVANIVADVVMMLTSDISKVIKRGGTFISSGIIVERVDEVRACIEKNGFKITEIRERRGWAAIKAQHIG